MSHFKAKMHKIRFPLGLHPRPHRGSLQRSPRPPSCISGRLLLRAERGKRGREKEGEWEGRRRRGEEGRGQAP